MEAQTDLVVAGPQQLDAMVVAQSMERHRSVTLQREQRLAMLEVIVNRRRNGRAGTLAEWTKAVVRTLDYPVWNGEKMATARFGTLIKYLNSRGLINKFCPFLPEMEDRITVDEIINGTYPTPRYLATTACGWWIKSEQEQTKIKAQFNHYFNNTDPQLELKYYKKLSKYNHITALWCRELWYKKHGVKNTREDRLRQFEASIRQPDNTDRLTEMMRLTINNDLVPYPEDMIIQTYEPDAFAEEGEDI